MSIYNLGYCNFAYCAETNYAIGIFGTGVNSQVLMAVISEPLVNSQVEMVFKDDLHTQVRMRIAKEVNLSSQVLMRIYTANELNSQVLMRVFTQNNINSQVLMRVFTSNQLNSQVLMRIRKDLKLNSQVLMRIFTQKNLFTQVNLASAGKVQTQVNLFLYNNIQLRILSTFDSRGTEDLNGENWTSVQDIAPGDFSPNNLNNDIVEYRTQTDGINSLWQLRCDTGKPNTFVNTIAILNHNFTSSAIVQFQGSDVSDFSSVKFLVNLNNTQENIYYCPSRQDLINTPARYFQFVIQDPSNPDPDGLKIGSIVFGDAIILSPSEQFVNPISYGLRHYKNSLETEGFTSVSNSRAVRRFLNLSFTQMLIDGQNFAKLKNYILTARTDLKCLIIPRPTRPELLAVFAKLSQMPEETHNSIDDDNWRVDLTFDWDESL